MTQRSKRRILLATLGCVGAVAVGCLCAIFWIDAALVAPAPSDVGPPPGDLSAKAVSFQSESGSVIHGWFITGRPGAGAVILMHALRGDRRAMLGRARFLAGAGYSVLLFDFQAHGESGGQHITFGFLESRDAQAAVRFVHSRLPGEPIAAIGTSLGGAACLLGDVPLAVDALVLEAVYPDVRRAVANRLCIRLGAPGRVLAPLLLWQLQPSLGIRQDQLRPIDRISRVRCPLLLVAGTDDRRTTIQESRALYAAAPEPKEMWEVKGAAHVDFYQYAGAEYERRIIAFLAHCLRDGGGKGGQYCGLQIADCRLQIEE
jgi:fermentation-respiration switch protein FrsA (DUF1100 family)